MGRLPWDCGETGLKDKDVHGRSTGQWVQRPGGGRTHGQEGEHGDEKLGGRVGRGRLKQACWVLRALRLLKVLAFSVQ